MSYSGSPYNLTTHLSHNLQYVRNLGFVPQLVTMVTMGGPTREQVEMCACGVHATSKVMRLVVGALS